MELVTNLIILSLATTTIIPGASPPPECDDGEDTTPCCPLDDLDNIIGLENWLHCLEKLPGAPALPAVG